MKKLLAFMLVLVVFATALVSCDFSSILEGTGGNGEGENTADGTVVWSPDVTPIIVTDESASDVEALTSHISTLIGKAPTLAATESAKSLNEIIIGDSERSVSKKAHVHLTIVSESIEDYVGNEKSSYAIYAEDGSLAVVYTNVYARDAAINYLLENYTEATATAENGVVAKQIFDTADFITAYRNSEREAAFAEIEKTLGAAAVSHLRDIYSRYGTDLYIWLANLYDPAVGGFYYSASARDTIGFAPDIESTAQVLDLIDNTALSKAFGGSFVNMLSESAKESILGFALGLQDADGYFYHPQWGKNINTSRRGRDLGWATGIILDLGSLPYYDAPNGVSGRGVTPASSEFALTGRLSLSVATAASKVIPAVSTELSSVENFRDYLESLKINENSNSAGNVLNAMAGEIASAGMLDTLREFLTETQNPDTGLWESEVSYNAINGLAAICDFFDKSNPMPNVEKAIDSTIEILMLNMEDELPTIRFIYNPWKALATIKASLTDEQLAGLDATLKENAAELFAKTLTKISLFSKEDGGFSMNPEASASMSQGVIAAVSNARESDVCATEIGVSTVVKYMLPCFGVEAPDIYCEYDSLYFLDTFATLGDLIKDTGAVETPEIITFKEYDPEIAEEGHGVVLYPNDIIVNVVDDKELDSEENYRYFRSGIVDDPAGSNKKVLFNQSIHYPDDRGKQYAVTTCPTQISIVNSAIPGNCYIFESDMYFEGEYYDAVVGYIDFASVSIPFSKDQSTRYEWYLYKDQTDGKSYLTLQESQWYYGEQGEITVLADKIPVGEWFHLRLEFYKQLTEDGSEIDAMYVKCYLNDEFTAECDTGRYTSAMYFINNVVDCVRVSPYRFTSSKFYYNNIYASKEMKPYQPEEID